VTDDPDLRSRLQRLASSAGDPSEHGLDRVAARRHRRLRRRRGAVATAAVLAVLAVGAPLISEGLDDDRESVSASETASPDGAPAEVPRIVEVHCAPTGILVPVASVRPQRDGLHIRVHNTLTEATALEVVGEGWSSGDIAVPPGLHEVRQPVPPGQLTIGCDIAGRRERRLVDLVDPAGYYQAPELACEESERVTLKDLPVDPPNQSIVTAARDAMEPHLVDGSRGDAIGAVRGYQSQRLSDATDDPVVQVAREGDVIALVHVRGEDGATEPPWTTVSVADVCGSVVEEGAEEGSDDARTEGTTTTSTTERPAAGTGPPE
jgi:hypothetical protein